jgi:hypothetical protein
MEAIAVSMLTPLRIRHIHRRQHRFGHSSGVRVREGISPRSRRRPACPASPVRSEDRQHAGECEFASVADPAVLKIVLKVQGRRGWELLVGGVRRLRTAWEVSYYAIALMGVPQILDATRRRSRSTSTTQRRGDCR